MQSPGRADVRTCVRPGGHWHTAADRLTGRCRRHQGACVWKQNVIISADVLKDRSSSCDSHADLALSLASSSSPPSRPPLPAAGRPQKAPGGCEARGSSPWGAERPRTLGGPPRHVLSHSVCTARGSGRVDVRAHPGPRPGWDRTREGGGQHSHFGFSGSIWLVLVIHNSFFLFNTHIYKQ